MTLRIIAGDAGASLRHAVPTVCTEVPTVRTAVPTVRTEVPTVSTEVPTVCTDVPTVRTEVPTVSTEVPTVCTDVPTVCTEVPTVSTEVPTVCTAVPTVCTEVPTVRTEVPTVSTEVPTVCTEVPTVRTEVPTVRTEVPTVCTEVPTVCTDVPTVCTEVPTVRTDVPTVCTDVPTVCTGVLTVCTEVPTVRTDIPTVCTEVPTVCTDVPTVCTTERVLTGVPGAPYSTPDTLLPIGGRLDAFSRGRADLAAWLDEQPRSFFEADVALQALVSSSFTADERGRWEAPLRAFGATAAGPLDAAVRENSLPRNLPALEPYDGIGRPLWRVANHPSFDEAGRLLYGTGMMAAYRETPPPHRYLATLFYLAAHTGENGHSSRMAATAGAIRALQALGTPEQQARCLPPLVDPSWDTNWTAGQYLTEVQGGSDVGANGTVAARAPDGTFRLHGEKWFCSNVDGDLFLVTARPEGAPPGTRGLGMFLMPARLADGAPNAVHVRRLKEKMGTRTMPSGEVDLAGAWAEALGPLERGVQNMVELVVGTSRLLNDFLCAGMAHRAYLVAAGFAAHRRAFGQPIAEHPLVRSALAMMLADAEASLAGAWLLAGLSERCDAGTATDAERAFVRLGVTVTKVHTAALTHDVVRRGIEVLGGNGAIETFSVLPRFLGDAVVAENWEGTPNVLALQALRDCKRLRLHEGFFSVVAAALGEDATLGERARVEEALAAPDDLGSLLFRPLADRLATLVYLTGLSPLRDEKVSLRARLTRARHLADGPGAAPLVLARDAL